MQIISKIMGAVLSWIIYYVCCTVCFDTRFEKFLNRFFYILYISGAMITVELFNNNNITVLFEIAMPLIFFKGNAIKKEMVYWGIVIGISILSTLINIGISKVLGLSNIELVEDAITVRMLFVLSLVICYYLISFLKIKVVNKFSHIRTPSIFHFSVVLILLMAIICFLIQIYRYELPKDIMKELENAICSIFMLVIIIEMIFFEILKKSIFQTRECMEEKAKLEFYEMQRKYDKLTTEQLKKLSALRHDFKNHLYVILERVKRKETEKAIEYIEKIQGYTEEAESIVMAENEILSTILTVKNAVCKSKNIIFQYEIACGEIYIEDFDLNIVVANLMDNAIEAAEKCKEGNRKILFKIKDVKQFLTIECSNTCQEILEFRQDKLKTTKTDKENHGHGFENIKETVIKYGGELEVTCKNGVFCIKIMMENI